MKKIIQNINRYFQKRKLRKLVSKLPDGTRSDLMHDLLGIIDIPNRLEKIRLTREIFRPYIEQLDAPCEKKVSDCRQEYSEKLERAGQNVIAPHFPITHMTIDHDLLEQKAKAKITLLSLEEEIMTIPQIQTFHLFAAVLGVLLSTVANFMTLSAKMGNDWLGGNEMLSTVGNGFFSLVLIVFEAIGLYLLLHFLPKKYGHGLGRLFGIIGAIILVISICVLIFARTEIETNAITNVQDSGRVE